MPLVEQRAPNLKKQFEDALDAIGQTARITEQLAKAEAEQQGIQQQLVAAREQSRFAGRLRATLGPRRGAEEQEEEKEKPDSQGPGGTPGEPPAEDDEDVGMEEPEASGAYQQWFQALDQADQELLLEHQRKLQRLAKRQRPGPYAGSSTQRPTEDEAKQQVAKVGAGGDGARDAAKAAATEPGEESG